MKMQIESVQNLLIKNYQSAKKVSNTKSSFNKSAKETSVDDLNVEISQEARSLSESVQGLRSAMVYLKEVNDVRQEKISAIKERIEEGYYDSAEVHQLLAENLMNIIR